MIEIEVSKERAEKIVDQMEKEVTRMNNTLNSFRSNDLTDTEAYRKLEAEKQDLEVDIGNIEEQIYEETPDGLAELFG